MANLAKFIFVFSSNSSKSILVLLSIIKATITSSSIPSPPSAEIAYAAASVIKGISKKACSTSYDEIFSPLLLMQSLILSTKTKCPDFSLIPASPV